MLLYDGFEVFPPWILLQIQWLLISINLVYKKIQVVSIKSIFDTASSVQLDINIENNIFGLSNKTRKTK